MKKLALAFVSVSISMASFTTQARTYTVNFFNSTQTTLTESISPNNSATHIECSGSCTSLPPGGTVSYKISSNESTIPWGPVSVWFTYIIKNSFWCDSTVEGMTFRYDINNYSTTTPNYYINVGEALPDGLYGNAITTKKCFE